MHALWRWVSKTVLFSLIILNGSVIQNSSVWFYSLLIFCGNGLLTVNLLLKYFLKFQLDEYCFFCTTQGFTSVLLLSYTLTPQRIIVFPFLRWQSLYVVQKALNPPTSASQLYGTIAKNESQSFVCMFVCFWKGLLSPAWPATFLVTHTGL